jgi:hypothetical protein
MLRKKIRLVFGTSAASQLRSTLEFLNVDRSAQHGFTNRLSPSFCWQMNANILFGIFQVNQKHAELILAGGNKISKTLARLRAQRP